MELTVDKQVEALAIVVSLEALEAPHLLLVCISRHQFISRKCNGMALSACGVCL